MPEILKLQISSTNIDENLAFATYEKFLRDEARWRFVDNAGIDRILFIPFGYDGNNYSLYIKQVYKIFKAIGIGVDVITDFGQGEYAQKIEDARGIVIGGNNLSTLLIGIKNYLVLLRDKLKHGTPYLGWNAGSILVSPKYIQQPVIPISSTCIDAVTTQVYCHFVDSEEERKVIEKFLKDNPQIPQVICLIDAPDGSGIRYEDDNDGIIYGSIPGKIAPRIFELVKDLGLIQV